MLYDQMNPFIFYYQYLTYFENNQFTQIIVKYKCISTNSLFLTPKYQTDHSQTTCDNILPQNCNHSHLYSKLHKIH